jgi:hypothetical protein
MNTLQAAAALILLPLSMSSFYNLAFAKSGNDFFYGHKPLTARLHGETETLAPSATVCANCHIPSESPIADLSGQAIGGDIRNKALLKRRSRRGGPEASYDANSFCRALRTGIDPVMISLPQKMPRYAVDDETCLAIWKYIGG